MYWGKIVFKNLLLFIIVFLLCSCQRVSLVKTKELSFITDGIPVYYGGWGMFINEEDNTEYIWFADAKEKKKILFFTLEGELKFEIPLNEAMNWRRVGGVAIKSLDTIIVVNFSSRDICDDQLAFIDRNGRCWKRISLNKMIQEEKGGDNYVYVNAGYSFFSGNTVFLRALWASRPQDEDITFADHDAFRSYYYPRKYSSPCILKFDINSQKSDLALSEIWRMICPDTNLFFPTIMYAVENNILFIHSQMDNRLFLYSTENLELEKIVTIKSKYTNIGMPPCTLEDRDSCYQEYPMHGRIIDILYDEYNEFYYFIVMHDIPKEERLFYLEAPFSILMYDKKLKKRGEQSFDGKVYDPGACMLTKEGLLIGYSTSRKDYDPTKARFDVFEVQK